jgi:hypothetical protein
MNILTQTTKNHKPEQQFSLTFFPDTLAKSQQHWHGDLPELWERLAASEAETKKNCR